MKESKQNANSEPDDVEADDVMLDSRYQVVIPVDAQHRWVTTEELLKARTGTEESTWLDDLMTERANGGPHGLD